MAQCISPLTIRNPKKGVDPQFITVPCGKCNFCLQNRRKEWSFRLWEEFKTATSAYFVTLTYNEENVPWGEGKMTLEKGRLQRFMKYLNEHQRKAGKPNVRYYATGEYGTETDRPHYHIIMFNLDNEIKKKLDEGKLWGEGHMYWRNVGVESIEYVTKYLIDADEEYTDREKPFSIMSKRPGLGASYMERKAKWNYNPEMKSDEVKYYTLWKGTKHRLPRYYKDKIFPDWVKNEQKNRAINEQMNIYSHEKERLQKWMEDPSKYMEDCRVRDHEQIRVKSKKLNTL